jgi:uncharacterized protein (TIGR04255 family)
VPEELLPSFRFPPVAEVAVSVEFTPIEWWGVPHFGLFWQLIRSNFPKVISTPPIASTIENFEKAAPPPVDAVSLTFGMDPNGIRCSFINDAGTDAVQIQRDRLIRNWQRTGPKMEYPRYANHIRPQFESSLSNFAEFISKNGDSGTKQINAQQVEVTYVNEFERQREWSDYPSLAGIFKLWNAEAVSSFLPSPYGMRAGISYNMPNHLGRLHVFVQRVTRAYDNAEVLQMKLTAKHRPTGSDIKSILASADICREWIVRSFADLTTAKMHSVWGRDQ